jgi:hypothetical protein
MRVPTRFVASAFFAAIAFITTSASAGVLATRGDLNGLLGGAAVTEDFNLLTIGGAGGQGSITGVLNNATNVPSLGTGQVVSGIEFSRSGTLNFSTDLYVPQTGYFGFANPALLSGSSTLQIDLTGGGTTAFGLDLLEYSGFSDRVSVDIYASDDVTLLATEQFYSVSSPTTPVFFGFTDAGGIGRVNVRGINTWSPIIDNVTFGAAGNQVPIPPTLPLVAVALVALAAANRRRA